jgi:hypothetical protein
MANKGRNLQRNLQGLETSLIRFRKDGITLNTRETAALARTFMQDVKEIRADETKGTFAKILQGIHKFLAGPGKELLKFVPMALSLL